LVRNLYEIHIYIYIYILTYSNKKTRKASLASWYYIDTTFNAKADSRVFEASFYGLEYFIPAPTLKEGLVHTHQWF